ncbi:MAG: universal stress protein [Cyanobacteria bacterium SZAS LIN-2]|nr:universal stress protein [Cyanobacteria bacterium SZAS LIN-3]MBS1998661.1 universal stress protein [Cyanobacteria bacterium SZAS LIN-2]MBS2006251.1 universal stress protein [Cyanobacteria bacterium SZAS TMP-1]
MNRKKILLAFDGSLQSLNAAELCWSLAGKYPVRLTAQHVINTVGLWQLLNYELPGLTGSGPYINAHQNMCQELRAIGETLVSIYETKAKAQGMADQCVLDEGDALSEVVRRARAHDLVVIGHHAAKPVPGAVISQGVRCLPLYPKQFSMAEELSRLLEKPLLIVQGKAPAWKKLKLILHGDQGVPEAFRAAADWCDFLRIELEVNSYFVDDEEDTDVFELAGLLKETKGLYPDLKVTVHKAKLWPSRTDSTKAQVECEEDALVMIPTLPGPDGRRSMFGTAPELFVRCSNVRSLMFWPALVDATAGAENMETAAVSK